MNFRSTQLAIASAALSGLFTIPAALPQNRPPAQAAVASNVVEAIEFRGVRQTPEDTLRALIAIKPGDVYSEEAVRRGFAALWNTSRFDDIHVGTGKGPRGGIVVTFTMTERR